jgi:hypothetical protein
MGAPTYQVPSRRLVIAGQAGIQQPILLVSVHESASHPVMWCGQVALFRDLSLVGWSEESHILLDTVARPEVPLTIFGAPLLHQGEASDAVSSNGPAVVG